MKTNLLTYACLACLLAVGVSCRKSAAAAVTPVDSTPALLDPATLKGAMVFQSNFEHPCRIVPFGTVNDRITGVDASLTGLQDWDALETTVLGSRPYFNYNGGDSLRRSARLSSDPVAPGNRVLRYRISDHWPDVSSGSVKARVQYEFYNIRSGFREYYQSVRLFLPEDFNLLRKYPNTIDWLTLVEIWNNITWSQSVPYGYRLTLGIGKPLPTEADLCFIVEGQDCLLRADGSQQYTTIWSDRALKVKVPVGRWFTMDYYFKEGDARNGRFYMTIQPDGGRAEKVFDITQFTHNTKDPSPDGVTHFNPMKLYTSSALVDYMKGLGKPLEIYWDEFRLWRR